MGELARGTVLDRPWGQTLAALASRGLTGEVTAISDGKAYLISFDQGIVVAASSPLGSDAAVRVALTGHLVSSTQVADIVRKQAAAPDREEIDVLAEAARLSPDQAMRLRRRVLAQRAARTFCLDRGEFVVDDTITLPLIPGSELDIRTVVYLGARQFLSESRLNAELDQLGGWFQIKPEAIEDLPQFGFGDGEQSVVEPLIRGADLIELQRPELDQRMVHAVVYSLVCTNMCMIEPNPRSARRVPAATLPPRPRPEDLVDSPTLRRSEVQDPPTQHRPAADRASPTAAPPRSPSPTAAPPRSPTPTAAPPRSPSPTAAPPRTPSTTAAPPRSGASPTSPPRSKSQTVPPGPRLPSRSSEAPPVGPRSSSSTSPPPMSRSPSRTIPPPTSTVFVDTPTAVGRKKVPTLAPPARRRQTDAPTLAIEALIKSKLAIQTQNVDHYAMIGVPRDATATQIRVAYFALARQLHPDRLTALGIDDTERRAQGLFAELNTAFGILSDPRRREEYTAILQRGGADGIRAEQAEAEELTKRVVEGEEAFRKGEMALRRDQIETAINELSRAVELNPDEADYHATLAWARFCGAPDKMAAATTTRKALDKAIKLSPEAVTPRFFLGRVERMLGRDPEALRLFREVLDEMPHHVEAGSEVRAIEARMAGDKGGGGLFGRSKR